MINDRDFLQPVKIFSEPAKKSRDRLANLHPTARRTATVGCIEFSIIYE